MSQMNMYASSEKAGEPCRKGLDVSKAINPQAAAQGGRWFETLM